jgi:hypothetical protein
LAVAVLAALAFSIACASASAHKVTYSTTLQLKVKSVDATTTEYSGKVTSESSRCLAGRTVEVTANGALIATATTLANGDWLATSAPPPAKGTTLIASTPRKFLKRSKKHRHKCASDLTERKAP